MSDVKTVNFTTRITWGIGASIEVIAYRLRVFVIGECERSRTMTREEAEKIRRGIEDKIENATGDMEWWADFWGFTLDEYDEFLDMAIKALEQEETYQNLTKPNKSDLISRQAAIDAVNRAKTQEVARWSIQELPSTDRPTGHWIETAQEYYEMINEKGGGVDENTPYFTDDIACSECLAKFSVIDNETERFDFCPNCGARMEALEARETETWHSRKGNIEMPKGLFDAIYYDDDE